MSIYDIVRPGWNKGWVIAIGLHGSMVIAAPPSHHSSDGWRAHTADNSYINPTVTPDEERYGNSKADRQRRHDDNWSKSHGHENDDADDDDDDCDDCDPE